MPRFVDVASQFEAIKKIYDGGSEPLDLIRQAGETALELVTQHPRRQLDQQYVNYGTPNTTEGVSRPIRSDLFLTDAAEFRRRWNAMASNLGSNALDVRAADSVLYTLTQSFASAYDLYKRGARKTPGTFFEIVIGSLLSRATRAERSKQVTLQVDGEPVTIPTDIYFEKLHLTVATKTSSRDRIIQPWSHQLLLDRIGTQLNLAPFRSILCLIGEVQLGRDEARPCYPVCVPKQVRLYQTHVSRMAGLYYLDPPAAYLALDRDGLLEVKTIGHLLAGNWPN